MEKLNEVFILISISIKRAYSKKMRFMFTSLLELDFLNNLKIRIIDDNICGKNEKNKLNVTIFKKF